MSALRKHIDEFHNIIPDTGNLRDDVISSNMLARESEIKTMMEILKHAELRGKVRIDKINPLRISHYSEMNLRYFFLFIKAKEIKISPNNNKLTILLYEKNSKKF